MRPHEQLAANSVFRYEWDSYTKDLNLSGGFSTVFSRSATQHVRLAVSRAVRIPAQIEHTASLVNFPDVEGSVTVVQGNEDLDAESVTAFEIGYRASWMEEALRLNVETFLQLFEDRIDPRGLAEDTGRSAFPFESILVVSPANVEDYTSVGVEVETRVRPTEILEVRGTYTFVQEIDRRSVSTEEVGVDADDTTPHHLATLTAELELGTGTRFRLTGHFASSFSAFDDTQLANVEVDDAFRLDAVAAQELLDGDVVISVIGQNVLDTQGVAFASEESEEASFRALEINEIPVGVFGQVEVRL